MAKNNKTKYVYYLNPGASIHPFPSIIVAYRRKIRDTKFEFLNSYSKKWQSSAHDIKSFNDKKYTVKREKISMTRAKELFPYGFK
jgi:hypothetical protein